MVVRGPVESRRAESSSEWQEIETFTTYTNNTMHQHTHNKWLVSWKGISLNWDLDISMVWRPWIYVELSVSSRQVECKYGTLSYPEFLAVNLILLPQASKMWGFLHGSFNKLQYAFCLLFLSVIKTNTCHEKAHFHLEISQDMKNNFHLSNILFTLDVRFHVRSDT